jgi:hypothetical protein
MAERLAVVCSAGRGENDWQKLPVCNGSDLGLVSVGSVTARGTLGPIRVFVHRFKIFIFSTCTWILFLGLAGGCRANFRELRDPELGGTCAT